MAFELTPEGISKLNLDEIRNLSENARRMGRDDIVTLCENEIDNRKPKTPRLRPDGTEKVVRSPKSRKMEAIAVDLLGSVADKVNSKYDLSPEKAKALSEGTKRFKAHGLTDSKGKAKVGGAQKNGEVVFERYLSYRLKDDIYALTVILGEGDDEADVQFQVGAPADDLENPKHLKDLRPYLKKDKFGLCPYAEEFSSFDKAAVFFESLIDKVAPKR